MAIQFLLLSVLLLVAQSPDQPTGLSVELDGDIAILTWQDNSLDEEGFWIYKDNAKHAMLPPDTTYYEDEVSDNQRHYYMVSSFIGDEESDLSNKVNVRSEGLSRRLVYYGIPLLAIVVIVIFFLGRGKEDEEDYEGEDEPVLLTDKLTKL